MMYKYKSYSRHLKWVIPQLSGVGLIELEHLFTIRIYGDDFMEVGFLFGHRNILHRKNWVN